MRVSSRGFTIPELVMSMLVVSILASFAAMKYADIMESTDAALVDASQSAVQSIVSQAAVRRQVNPTALAGANVVNACRANLPERASLTPGGGASYTLNITNTGRNARYQVNANGSVILTNLGGFYGYNISPDGTIQKL